MYHCFCLRMKLAHGYKMVEGFLSLACQAILCFGQFDIRVLKLSHATHGIDTIALYWLLLRTGKFGNKTVLWSRC